MGAAGSVAFRRRRTRFTSPGWKRRSPRATRRKRGGTHPGSITDRIPAHPPSAPGISKFQPFPYAGAGGDNLNHKTSRRTAYCLGGTEVGHSAFAPRHPRPRRRLCAMIVPIIARIANPVQNKSVSWEIAGKTADSPSAFGKNRERGGGRRARRRFGKPAPGSKPANGPGRRGMITACPRP